MALSFRIFKLDTSLVISNDTQNVEVINFGSLDETLELDAGVFEVGNMNVTCRGLAADYLETAGDIDNIFMFLVFRDTDDLVWHGIIDAPSVSYNRKTGYTSFDVVSWEFLLEQAGDVPERSIFETQLINIAYDSEGIVEFQIFDGDAANMQLGDVVIFKLTDGTERRVPIHAIDTLGSTDFDTIKVSYPPEEVRFDITSAQYTFVESNSNDSPDRLLITNLSKAQLLHDFYPPNMSWGFNAATFKFPVEFYTGATLNGKKNIMTISYQPPLHSGAALAAGEAYAIISFQTHIPDSYKGTFNKITLVTRAFPQLDDNNTLQVLGRDMYGYAGTQTFADYDTATLIESMLTLQSGSTNPFGVLSHIVQTPINVIGGDGVADINRVVQLPKKPLEALRMIQMTSQTFLRFRPTWNAGTGKPELEVDMIPREEVNDTSGAPTTVPSSNIIEWSDSVATVGVRAVIVKANHEYNKPAGDSEWIGVYDPKLEVSGVDFDVLNPPTGEDVLEIDVSAVPSYVIAQSEGDSADQVFGGDGKSINNDEKLKAIAKRYYDFYTIDGDTMRPMSARIAVHDPSDLLGKFVSFNEGALTETIFVTKVSKNLRPNTLDTSIEGLRSPDYIPATPVNPVAVITGDTSMEDTDDSGDETITLSGMQSYDALSQKLEYVWKVDTVQQGTGPIFTHTLNAGASYTVELTVTNPDTGLSGSDSVTVTIFDNDNAANWTPPTGVLDGAFEVEKVQVNDGGTEYGEIRIFPKVDTSLIDYVRYRAASGGELGALDKTVGDPTTWYPNLATDLVASDGYYRCRVAISNKHTSTIEVWIQFTASTGREPVTIHSTFDFLKIPNLNGAIQLIGDTVYLSYEGDEDTAQVRYAKSTVSLPSDATVDASSDVIVGQSNQGTSIHTGLAEGDTIYVKFKGESSGGADSEYYISRTLTRPVSGTGLQAPTADFDYDQDGTNGSINITLVDPESRITNVKIWQMVGGSDTWTLVVNDSTPPFAVTDSVALTSNEKHQSGHKALITWDDDVPNDNYISSSHRYDRNSKAEYKSHSLSVEEDGTVRFNVSGDEDTKSLRIWWSKTDTDPSTNVIDVDTDESYPTTGEYATLTTLSKGEKIYVKVNFYAETNQAGSLGDTKYFASSADSEDDGVIAPTVDLTTVSQTSTLGTVTASVDDPQSRATAFRMYRRAGQNSEVLAVNDTSSPFSGTASVTLEQGHSSYIRWELDWNDGTGSKTIHGSQPFTKQLYAEYLKHNVKIEPDGDTYVSVAGNEDTASMRINWEANDSTPDNVINISGNDYNESLATLLTTLNDGDVLYLQFTFYTGASQTGSSTVRSFQYRYDELTVADGSVAADQLADSAAQMDISWVGSKVAATDHDTISWGIFDLHFKSGDNNGGAGYEFNGGTYNFAAVPAGTPRYFYEANVTSISSSGNTVSNTGSINDITSNQNARLLWVAWRGDNSGDGTEKATVVDINGDMLITAARIDVVYLSALTASIGAMNITHALTVNSGGSIEVGNTTNGVLITDSHIRGYGGGTVQVEINASNGKLTAGGGDVTLDEDGITITAGTGGESNQLLFKDGAVVEMTVDGRTDGSCFITAHNGLLTLQGATSNGVKIQESSGGTRIEVNQSVGVKVTVGGGDPFEVSAPKAIFSGLTSGLFIEHGAAATVSSGQGLLYVDSSGNLRYKGTSSDTQIAPN